MADFCRQFNGDKDAPSAGSADILSAQLLDIAHEIGLSLSRCALIADKDVCAPGNQPCVQNLRRYLAGSKIKTSFVAFSTAPLLNGSARGVTLRQSSS